VMIFVPILIEYVMRWFYQNLIKASYFNDKNH
jgi:hypothetical protein